MARTSDRLAADAYLSFAVFGAYWGAWGASIPRIRAQAGVDDGQLGFALLFVGGGALAAMLVAGRAVDRFGLRVAALLLPATCVAGAAMALAARGLPALCTLLAVVGAVSGGADVAINALAGKAEAAAGGAVLTRAHGCFSTAVVLASVLTGAGAAAGLPAAAPFLVVAGTAVLVGLRLGRSLPAGAADGTRRGATAAESAAVGAREFRLFGLVLVGGLGALAFATENAHQSWSAVFVHETLHASTAVAAGAPALFAAVVALARFGAGRIPYRRSRFVLIAGAALAAVGSTVLAEAGNLAVAGLGLAAAAAGTAVLFPTLMRIVARNVDDGRRGRATSVVTFVSYGGFLLGPVYVGAFAELTGLRAAMLAVAGLAASLALLAAPLLHSAVSPRRREAAARR